jgi:threonine/homoserine/homoserine lactone efflux protein
VIQTVPVLSIVLKIVGSAYLLWLAIRIGTAGAPKSVAGKAAPVGFLGGLLLLLVNPKGWTMALGAAASFSTIAADPLRLAAIMGVTFGLAAIVSLSLWCLGGTILARALSTERQWLILNVALAVLLTASIIPIWLG